MSKQNAISNAYHSNLHRAKSFDRKVFLAFSNVLNQDRCKTVYYTALIEMEEREHEKQCMHMLENCILADFLHAFFFLFGAACSSTELNQLDD